jgi:hypothetical protein
MADRSKGNFVYTTIVGKSLHNWNFDSILVLWQASRCTGMEVRCVLFDIFNHIVFDNWFDDPNHWSNCAL